MLDSLSAMSLTWAIALIAITLIARFFVLLHAQRSRHKHLPGPPHSYLFGSIPAMAKLAIKSPRNLAPQALFKAMKDAYNLPDVFYFDPWPLASFSIMVISDVEVMNELAVKNSYPKHPVIEDFMINFGGPGNLVSSDGPEWKKWRSAFNPGFSTSHMMTQVPTVVEECQTFLNIMTEHAKKNNLFRMESAATKLTVNIIGRIILDVDLNAQKGRNVLVDSFNSNVRWQAVGVQFQPSELIDYRRKIIQPYNNWRMGRYLSDCLDERFATRESRGRTKHVIDLALEAYLKEVKGTTGDTTKVQGLDPEFKQAAISNMKTFIFAGHDTTSSTICYAFYYLSQNPDCLAKIRKEHDEVFGTDPDSVAEQLLKDGHLINKLDYTLAITKEVLRIQPPASTIRAARPGQVLHDPETGEGVPTENFLIWPLNVAIHRNPKYWKDPGTFNPDRFLPDTTSTDNKDAWVPFSKGTRNCIGQELAIIETKVILAMIIRKFDFLPAYDEVGKLKNDGSGYPSYTTGVLEQFGERAYQIQLGTAKPNEGMPCRLRLR